MRECFTARKKKQMGERPEIHLCCYVMIRHRGTKLFAQLHSDNFSQIGGLIHCLDTVCPFSMNPTEARNSGIDALPLGHLPTVEGSRRETPERERVLSFYPENNFFAYLLHTTQPFAPWEPSTLQHWRAGHPAVGSEMKSNLPQVKKAWI